MTLAIIGCGDASATIALAVRFARGVRVVVACDSDQARRERFARAFHCDAVADWRELLGDERVEAAYVAVPHDLHASITLELARAGKAVLLEKPLAHTLHAGLEIVNSLPGAAKVAVNYQYRYDPAAWKLVREVGDGRIGTVRYARVVVPWQRGAHYMTGWHAQNERAGGGTLLTQASHALDIALLACGDPRFAIGRAYRAVHVDAGVEDLAAGVVETTRGVPVSIVSSMVSVPPDRVTIEIGGSRGTLVYRGPQRARLRGRGVRVASPVVFTQLHSYVASLVGFRDWVSRGDSPRCTARDSLPVLRAVDALYRSATSGHTEEA